MNHYFDVEEAKKIGLENAVVLYQMKESEKELMTVSDLMRMFPYFAESQIRCRLRILKEMRLISLVCIYSGRNKQWFYRVEKHGDLGMFGEEDIK